MFYGTLKNQKKINCTSIIITYKVPINFNMKNLNNIKIHIKVHENEKYIGSINSGFIFNTDLCDKEIELLKK